MGGWWSGERVVDVRTSLVRVRHGHSDLHFNSDGHAHAHARRRTLDNHPSKQHVPSHRGASRTGRVVCAINVGGIMNDPQTRLMCPNYSSNLRISKGGEARIAFRAICNAIYTNEGESDLKFPVSQPTPQSHCLHALATNRRKLHVCIQLSSGGLNRRSMPRYI